jgi:hypothetical protein
MEGATASDVAFGMCGDGAVAIGAGLAGASGGGTSSSRTDHPA